MLAYQRLVKRPNLIPKWLIIGPLNFSKIKYAKKEDKNVVKKIMNFDELDVNSIQFNLLRNLLLQS